MGDKRVGKIIHCDTQRKHFFIPEEGEEGKIYEFAPAWVNSGVLALREIPSAAHIKNGDYVIFTVDRGYVESISPFVFREVQHDRCGDDVTLAVSKRCGRCGSETYRSYASCTLCAFKDGTCAKCGEPLPKKSIIPRLTLHA